MNILIVDDMPENILLLQAMMEGAGYRVLTARNGLEALDILRKESVSIIISDVLMPVMDGFQLCRECKTNTVWQNIPFVFYTANYVEKKDEDFAYSIGAEAYIMKPQEPEVFLKLIAEIIKRPRDRNTLLSKEPNINELKYLSEHNKRLISKLENKMSQLEETNRSLQASEKKYRLLAENAQDVIFVVDLELNYIYVSPSVKILRGYDTAEVLRQSALETLTASSWELATKTVTEELALERTGNADLHRSRIVELEMKRKDGTTVWTEVKVSLLRDEKNQVTGILGVTRDISKRKQAEIALDRSLHNLQKTLNGTIQAIAKLIEARDPYTAGHEKRVSHLAGAIVEEMSLENECIESLRMAGMIHDIGKVAVPAEILSKPTRLTSTEMLLIKIHPQIGYEILKEIEFPWPLAQTIYQHHERMDGSGYPNGLKGENILMEARILCVADVVEAIASHRPYRPALGIEIALEEIKKNRGIFYDDNVVKACLKLFHEKNYKFEN